MSPDLTLGTRWAEFGRWQIGAIYFWFFSQNSIWHFMQIVSSGDNLHEMSNQIF